MQIPKLLPLSQISSNPPSFHQLRTFTKLGQLANFQPFAICFPSFHQLTIFCQLAIRRANPQTFHRLAKISAVQRLFTIFSPTNARKTHSPTACPNISAVHNLFTIFLPSFHQLANCLPSIFHELAKFSRIRQHFASLSNLQQFAICCPAFHHLVTSSQSQSVHQLAHFSAFPTCKLFTNSIVSPSLRKLAKIHKLTIFHKRLVNLPDFHQLTIFSPTFNLLQPTVFSPSSHHLPQGSLTRRLFANLADVHRLPFFLHLHTFHISQTERLFTIFCPTCKLFTNPPSSDPQPSHRFQTVTPAPLITAPHFTKLSPAYFSSVTNFSPAFTTNSPYCGIADDTERSFKQRTHHSMT